MSKQKTLVKNTFIIAAGKLSTQFLTFLLLPLYTSHLLASEFGTVDLITTYVTLLVPLVTLSLEMAVFRYLIDIRNDQAAIHRVISSVLSLVGISLLIFISAFTVLQHYIEIPHAAIILCVIMAIICTNIMMQVARGMGRNAVYSIGSVIAGVTTILANIVLIVQLNMGVSGVLMATILGNVACAVFLIVKLRIHRYVGRGDLRTMNRLLRYSLPLIPNSVSWWVVNAADRSIIALFLGVTSNGIFAVAYKFPVIFSALLSFYGMSWTESASVHINSKDRDLFFSQAINASTRLFGALGLCIIAGVPIIFSLLVNTTYHDAYSYIPILMLGAVSNFFVQIYSGIYIAKKMTKRVLNSTLLAALVSIGLTLLLIPGLGLYAPATGMLAGYMSMAIFRFYDIKKFVDIQYDIKSLTTLALAFATVIILYYINNPFLNVMNLLVAVFFSIALNRSIIKIVKRKIFARLRPLTPDQQILEEIEEKKL